MKARSAPQVLHGRRAALRRLVTTLVGALALSALTWPAAAAGTAPVPDPGKAVSTFGVAPANEHKIDGRPSFFYSASPGAQLTDHVAIVNAGTSPVELSVYASGAVSSSTGEFALAAVKDKDQGVGGWVQLAATSAPLIIPARTDAGPSVVLVPLTLHVPADASPGDHAGGVVAQLNSMAISKSGQRLQLLQRVAARVFVRVSGPLHPELAVEQLRASYSGPLTPTKAGRTKVDFVVHNTGNVKLGGAISVTISGPLGLTERIKLPVVPLLIPGSAIPESTTIAGVYPAVLMTATVSVDGMALPGDVDPGRTPTSASVTFWAWPWLLLLMLGLLTGVLAWFALRSRLRPGHHNPGASAGHAKHDRTPSHARS